MCCIFTGLIFLKIRNLSFEREGIKCPLWEPSVGAVHRCLPGGFPLTLIPVCFSPFPVSSVSVELLQRPQRGAVQAAAQAGAAPALVAEAGAAEGQVAPAGTPARPIPAPQTPAPLAHSGSSGQDLMDTALPSKNKPTNHKRIKTPQTQTRQLFVCTCWQWSSIDPFCQLPGKTMELRGIPLYPDQDPCVASFLPSPGSTRNCV